MIQWVKLGFATFNSLFLEYRAVFTFRLADSASVFFFFWRGIVELFVNFSNNADDVSLFSFLLNFSRISVCIIFIYKYYDHFFHTVRIS